MIVDAPTIQAVCAVGASCDSLATSCTLRAGWRDQVLYRNPDTTLALGAHGDAQSDWSRQFDMTSLSSEVAGICAWNYSSSPTGIGHFLIIAAPAFNGDATSSQRRRDLIMRQASDDRQGHALLLTSGVPQPAALDIETHRSVNGWYARGRESSRDGISSDFHLRPR